jgi:ATP adenylyltransferase
MDLLEKWDLSAAYTCLKAWEKDDEAVEEPEQSGDVVSVSRRKRKLFAFFNSGPLSGASQPHRHVQFLPVEEMTSSNTSGDSSPSSRGDDWTLLVDSITKSRGRQQETKELPFKVFTATLPASLGLSAEYLYQAYLDLYHQAVETCETYAVAHPDERDCLLHLATADDETGTINQHSEESIGIPSKISYNLALTTTSIALCPRRREGTKLWKDDGPESKEGIIGEGEVALNGTILAGTLMVKAEKEWDELRQNSEKLAVVLEAVGIPPRSYSRQDNVDHGRDGGGKL